MRWPHLVGGRAQTKHGKADENDIPAGVDLLFIVSINAEIIEQFICFYIFLHLGAKSLKIRNF